MIRRLIEAASILGAICGLVGFGSMVAMVMAYAHLPREMYGPFQAAVFVFMGSIIWCFVVWLLGAWYDRVQLRKQQEAWRREAWHGMRPEHFKRP